MTDREFSQSWLTVADRISRGGDHIFLCNEWLFCGAGEQYDINNRMRRFSNGFRDRGVNGIELCDCWFNRENTPNYQELRVLFACLFSNMTVKEFEEITQ